MPATGTTGATGPTGGTATTGTTGTTGATGAKPTPVLETTTSGTPTSVGFAVALSVIVILSFFIFLTSGSIFAILAFWLMLGLAAVVLMSYGYISIDSVPPGAVVPVPNSKDLTNPLGEQANARLKGLEVYHVYDGKFTYEEAPAVCAAYGGELATLEQINDAYNHGAEWCGYGWSQGGLALFPTQRATWQALQQEQDLAKRTGCGRVGVNGGYFDPKTKFGVNCYGYKPDGVAKFPLPPPGTNKTAFDAMVAKFKAALKTFTLSPYSRYEWSGYDNAAVVSASNYGSQFKQNLGGLVTIHTEHMENMSSYPSPADQVNLSTTTSTLGALRQAGLVGNTGPTGDIGPSGPQGVQGITGAASTVPGPTGSTGAMGPTGSTGPTGSAGAAGIAGRDGAQGAAGAPGSTGPTGAAGKDGAAAAAGKDGATGPKGDKGDRGLQGPQGIKGDRGLQGVAGVVPLDAKFNKIQLGSTYIKSDNVDGGRIVLGTDGKGDGMTLRPADWSYMQLRRGGNWKTYD
jgi:hypothetical protein